MNFAQLRTAHAWLGLLANIAAGAEAFLIMTNSHHVYTMGALAMALILLQQAGITTAAAWLPPSVKEKLSEGDLHRYVAGAVQALDPGVAFRPEPKVEETKP